MEVNVPELTPIPDITIEGFTVQQFLGRNVTSQKQLFGQAVNDFALNLVHNSNLGEFHIDTVEVQQNEEEEEEEELDDDEYFEHHYFRGDKGFYDQPIFIEDQLMVPLEDENEEKKRFLEVIPKLLWNAVYQNDRDEFDRLIDYINKNHDSKLENKKICELVSYEHGPLKITPLMFIMSKRHRRIFFNKLNESFQYHVANTILDIFITCGYKLADPGYSNQILFFMNRINKVFISDIVLFDKLLKLNPVFILFVRILENVFFNINEFRFMFSLDRHEDSYCDLINQKKKEYRILFMKMFDEKVSTIENFNHLNWLPFTVACLLNDDEMFEKYKNLDKAIDMNRFIYRDSLTFAIFHLNTKFFNYIVKHKDFEYGVMPAPVSKKHIDALSMAVYLEREDILKFLLSHSKIKIPLFNQNTNLVITAISKGVFYEKDEIQMIRRNIKMPSYYPLFNAKRGISSVGLRFLKLIFSHQKMKDSEFVFRINLLNFAIEINNFNIVRFILDLPSEKMSLEQSPLSNNSKDLFGVNSYYMNHITPFCQLGHFDENEFIDPVIPYKNYKAIFLALLRDRRIPFDNECLFGEDNFFETFVNRIDGQKCLYEFFKHPKFVIKNHEIMAILRSSDERFVKFLYTIYHQRHKLDASPLNMVLLEQNEENSVYVQAIRTMSQNDQAKKEELVRSFFEDIKYQSFYASDIYAITSHYKTGFLDFKSDLDVNEKTEKQKRFFQIMKKIGLNEVNMKICNMVTNSTKEFINTEIFQCCYDDVERGFL